MKRPSIFVINAILRGVDKGQGYSHRARFGELAKCTPELRNEKSLGEYLKLLVEELHWLEKFDEAKVTPYNPLKEYRAKRWKVSYYRLSPLGKEFLALFPRNLPTATSFVEHEDEEQAPEDDEEWEAFKNQQLDVAGQDRELVAWVRWKKQKRRRPP